ncbi:hypothetical protein [Leptospira licerasiae]|uniref:XRE family transcriptional regulator n=1 Tax=Leptospira licerasiae str. MMD4847 TaxID=1049971 RepID=A0ABN0H926_9LEPT|nr:hypothetical protein [Leptospira licerasiae]EIE01480.1 hypothetical protein LEP1GSC185_3897 [Leptospira licerasiae serovar Varillal str. VAR 010]EJZ42258.1 hypothetical protein LEP1GSC178_0063 [Leptospira licerasiae str. MMD4847]
MNPDHLLEESRRFNEGIKKLGYSSHDIQNITGASQSTVSRWKMGSHRIPDPELKILLLSIGLSIIYVRTGKGRFIASEEEYIQVLENLQNMGFDRSKLYSNIQLNRIDHKSSLLEFSDQEIIIQVANSLINNPEEKALRSLISIISVLPGKDQKALLKDAIKMEEESLSKVTKKK